MQTEIHSTAKHRVEERLMVLFSFFAALVRTRFEMEIPAMVNAAFVLKQHLLQASQAPGGAKTKCPAISGAFPFFCDLVKIQT